MTYSTVQGDTFDIISKRVYQDEGFCGQIMESNPQHMETVIFSAGVLLDIPDRPAPSPADNLPPWRRRL